MGREFGLLAGEKSKTWSHIVLSDRQLEGCVKVLVSGCWAGSWDAAAKKTCPVARDGSSVTECLGDVRHFQKWKPSKRVNTMGFVILDEKTTGIGYPQSTRNQYNVQLVSRI
jgi:hypothetical protein